MQDNSGLYFIVGAIVVVVGAIAFYNYNNGGLTTGGTSPTVVERNTIVNPAPVNEETTIVNPPAENTTIVNPPRREEPTRLDIDIDTDR